eukprot:TRINITY_DN1269_c2_g3_i1.p1 TRINITY_DN1269_c2_g3~~TRINITY_DN1269_c2_g3_i1.p1  ORF type:complete len:800 (+),score=144.93 TRINITY_DN1269_c2_g3_i1:57-2402(+)
MELLRARLSEWRPSAIDALALAPAGTREPRLAVGRANGAIELWDTRTWHLRRSSPGFERRSFRGFVWVPGAAEDEPWRLLSAGLHTEVTEWDTQSLKSVVSVASGGGAVWALCAAAGQLFVACDDGSVRVFTYDGGMGELHYRRRYAVGTERILSVALGGEDSGFLFAGGADGRITKWSARGGACEAKMQLERPAGGGEALVWSLAGLGERELASGDSLGLVLIWDTVSCTVLHRLVQHQADVLALAPTMHGLLLSSGVDAKVSSFCRQNDAEQRWSFRDASHAHSHDVRALAVDYALGGSNGVSGIRGGWYVSGGLSGELIVHGLRLQSGGDSSRTVADTDGSAPGASQSKVIRCSGFSPLFQKATVAQDSRLVLCQRDAQLELWYLQQPEVAFSDAGTAPVARLGPVPVGGARLPEAQLLLRVALNSGGGGGHIAASAIAPDGRYFAASDLLGTRLFRFDAESLEVHREQAIPKEVSKAPASALLFCGTGLLVVALSGDSAEVVVLDCTRLSVVARFPEHGDFSASLLAASGEWLATADVGSPCGVHVFNIDSLRHHSRVPVGDGRGFPTALGFDARGKRVIVALSSHEILLFDVDAKALVRDLAPATSCIPRELVPSHSRVCGVASISAKFPQKVLVWGDNFLLTVDLDHPREEETSTKSPSKRSRRSMENAAPAANGTRALSVPKRGACVLGAWRRHPQVQHVLALQPLDASQWGNPVLKDYRVEPVACSANGKRKAASENVVAAMALSLEVSPQAVSASLPQAFERKKFVAEGRPR